MTNEQDGVDLQPQFEAVVNVSEGQTHAALAALVNACGEHLYDLHIDAHHNRSVFTLCANSAAAVFATAQDLARATWQHIDIRRHTGVHPRFGALDVVPFVDLRDWESRGAAPSATAASLRNDFASWAEADGVICVRYGTDLGVELPAARRQLRTGDAAPTAAGTTCVGARGPLVAYNVWVGSTTFSAAVEAARKCAETLRAPRLRTLGLAVGTRAQVSMNLIDPIAYGPVAAFEAVANTITELGGTVEGAEVVGLVPNACIAAATAAETARAGIDETDVLESRFGLTRAQRAGLITERLNRLHHQ